MIDLFNKIKEKFPEFELKGKDLVYENDDWILEFWFWNEDAITVFIKTKKQKRMLEGKTVYRGILEDYSYEEFLEKYSKETKIENLVEKIWRDLDG